MKHYSFTTHWLITAPLALSHQLIEDVSNWPKWWIGLVSVQVVDKTTKIIGSQTDMIWRANLGYHLHIRLSILDHQPAKEIIFTSSGDLIGDGSWHFNERGPHTEMTIIWNVATSKSWMNSLAPLLRPIFILSHQKLMRNGEKGLNNYIKTLQQ